MATNFRLERRPRTRKYSKELGDELRAAYKKEMFPAIETKYGEIANFSEWKRPPKFRYVVKINSKRILVECKLDMRYNPSKAFWYMDKGTGLDGPTGAEYMIATLDYPYLIFTVPYQPITYPTDAQLRYDPAAPEHVVKKNPVWHPGIKARHFSEVVVEWVKDKSNSRGLWNTTEKAYKRVFNRTKGSKA